MAMTGSRDQLGLTLSDHPRIRRSLPVLDERLRGTKFVSFTPKSILNSPQQTGVDFWSLNPYVGCEFGCSYCYARYAHRYVVERAHDTGTLSDGEFQEFRGPHGWEAFERRIFVKDQLLGALEADLRRYYRSIGPSARQSVPIVIGTATDPYQPAERRFRLTRLILERLARCEGLNIGIITKSPLVARDRDVLRRLQDSNDLEVYVSLISVDGALIRKIEARPPRAGRSRWGSVVAAVRGRAAGRHPPARSSEPSWVRPRARPQPGTHRRASARVGARCPRAAKTAPRGSMAAPRPSRPSARH